MNNKKSLFEKLNLVKSIETDSKDDSNTNSINNHKTISSLNNTNNDDTDVSINEHKISNTDEAVSIKNFETTSSELKEALNNNNNNNNINFNELNSIENIYNSYNIKVVNLESVFTIENFVKALPENLPTEVKKNSVINLLSASGIKYESLIEDGYNRISTLNSYSENFFEQTSSISKDYKDKIKNLEQKIQSYKSLINNMEELQSEQSSIIEYELNKINGIIEFIKK